MAKKFYVVWRGVKTGVFHDWPTALRWSTVSPARSTSRFPRSARRRPRFAAARRARSTAPSGRPSHASSARTTRMQSPAFDTVIFCDGACEPNPGKAGSGMAVYREGALASLWYGAFNPAGTNNTAELNALLQALLLAQTEIDADKTVQVRSDSSYGLNAVTKWAAGWKKRGWRKADGEIKNLEIIQELFALYEEIEDDVKLAHVSAHVGIEGNELADRMAMFAVEQSRSGHGANTTRRSTSTNY